MQAHDFYEKRGGSAIILARFLPIVRTFAPIVAGVVRMDGKKFFLYNIIGSIAWVASMTLRVTCSVRMCGCTTTLRKS